jgi:hypothetical protein
MKAQLAVRHLNADIRAMHTAQASEKKALGAIATKEQAVIDAFLATPAPSTAQELALMKQVYALGQQSAHTKDHFDAVIAKDKRAAISLLKPATPALSFKQLNADRKALGLKALKAPPPPVHKGVNALKIAQAHLGKNIQDLKYHGDLAKYLDKWPSSHVCCANFVTACLEKAGLIKHSEHNDTVRYMASNLRDDPKWRAVSSSHLQPGDVVCFNVPGEGSYAHTEIFQGYKHGRPYFIGSNNVNPDGSQRISVGPAGYHIDAVFRYHG